MSVKDKNVVVTGGSRGLGLGLVEALVARGARVTVVARGTEALDSVRARPGVATISRRCDGRDRSPPHPCRDPAGHRGVERRRDAANGTVGPADLGGFHRALGTRRQGRALLAAGGAQPAAQARKPGLGGIERRGRERIADVGRLRRRQAHALAHGQIRQMASRRRSASGSAFRRSCRSRWSSAPGSVMRALMPTRTPWA
jgi:NAD(P)-dependent dehydrogenase (short-subunit alcohol dehydrogenase family)